MSQYDFLPKKGFKPARLTDQISNDCARPGNPNYNEYIKLWKTLPATSKAESLRINPALLASPAIKYTQQLFSMPDGPCNQFAGPTFTRTRNILALQQCTGCHTKETGTCFQHITNRPTNGSAQLSKFLTGNNAQPTIRQLWLADPAAVDHEKVPYYVEVGTSGTHCPPTTATADRYFHDLGRRALFMAAVLRYNAETPQAVEVIQGFKANFAH
jgi:hypothetical protein